MWPLHLKPKPDELLSSWIIRLAFAHRLKVETFCTLMFGYKSTIWNRDIDILAPEPIKEKLIVATGITREEFAKTTLKSYEGELFEKINTHGLGRWILSLGIQHRNRKRHGLLYCPACLASDNDPYFRRQWRLAFSVVCTKHRCWLKEGCPECSAPIAPHRVDMYSKSGVPDKRLIFKCWRCGANLACLDHAEQADDSLIDLQVSLENTLNQGWLDWAGNNSMYSIVFFEGLHQLISGIISKKTQNRFKNSSLSNEFHENERNDRVLEYSTLKFRRKILQLCSKLLDRWPDSYVDIIHACKLRYSDLTYYNRPAVYWYETIIKRESWLGNPVFTNDEKAKLISLVEHKYGYYTNVTARAISGRDISYFARDIFESTITEDIYNDLLVSLDHEIAGTQVINKKLLLIRDKIMFATAYIFKLTQSQLANIHTNDKLIEINGNNRPDFYHNSKTPKDVSCWLNWYLINIRPRLNPNNNCNYLFTSINTGHGIKESTIGSRFMRAVNASHLHRYIKSYRMWIN